MHIYHLYCTCTTAHTATAHAHLPFTLYITGYNDTCTHAVHSVCLGSAYSVHVHITTYGACAYSTYCLCWFTVGARVQHILILKPSYSQSYRQCSLDR